MSEAVAHLAPTPAATLRAPLSKAAWRLAVSLTGAFVLLLVALIPFARVEGPHMPQLIAVFATGVIVCDLATGFVLLQQLRATPTWSALLIACAYLFSAAMGVGHILTFPGVLIPGRAVIGGDQLANYVFDVWRAGYGAPIIAGAILRDRPLGPRGRRAVGWLPAVMVLAAPALLALGAAYESHLPVFMDGARYTGEAMRSSLPGVTLACIAALWLWLRRSRDSQFQLWLAVAMTAFAADILLGYLGGGRFTVGWYAGRAAGVLSACVLFLFFLIQAAAQQRLALQTARDLAERTQSLQAEIVRRAEAEERLAQAQKMEAMGQLTGGIAHDFNNLITAINGNLDMLLRGKEVDERTLRLAGAARDAAKRGARLAGQMLAFARTRKLETEPLDVRAVIEDSREMLVRALGPEVEAHFDLAASPSLVLAETAQLELALLNLFLNARDAMPGGGRITVHTAAVTLSGDSDLEPGDYLRLTVADTGEGMDADIARRAFDPFFTTKGVGKGTGLGLSQVFGFMRRVGGSAVIESRPGEGTDLHLYFRCTEEPVQELA